MRNKNTYSRFLQNVLPWKEFPKGGMIQALHHCVENDITSFDNSDFSGNHTVGKLFGVALSESGLSRDEIQLISKYSTTDSRRNLVTTLDELLIELETDYLDLLLLREEQLTEAVRNEVEQLISQGKLADIGGLNVPEEALSNFGMPLKVNMFPSPLIVANSLQHLPPVEEVPEEVIYFINLHATDDSTSLPDILKKLAPAYHCSAPQLFLAWLLQHPAHLHVEIGYTEKEELTDAIAAKEKRIDPVDWQKIRVALDGNYPSP